jgi:hypothetical protein
MIAMTLIQAIAGINRCPQCGQTGMFSPTACWQAGQVFIAVKVFSTGGDVKRSATVRAIVDEGEKLQIDFGHEETALVKTSQVVDQSDATA